jgi:integrase
VIDLRSFKRVNWDTGQVGIPGRDAKDRENRRVPFNPNGRLAAVLKRRSELGPEAFVFGSANGTYQPNIQTAWETLKLLAYGVEPKPGKDRAAWNQEQLRRIDLRWHDLRHEGACRLLVDRVDIRIIQLVLGHASIQQTQRYLNVTDEELRRGLEGELEERRPTASTGVRKLIGLDVSPNCPRVVPGSSKLGCGGGI